MDARLTMSPMGSLLGRWHQWRSGYPMERKYARAALLHAEDDEAVLDRLTMENIEAEIDRMPKDMQLALQHVARRECLGVEVMFNPHLNTPDLQALCDRAVKELERRLLRGGLL